MSRFCLNGSVQVLKTMKPVTMLYERILLTDISAASTIHSRPPFFVFTKLKSYFNDKRFDAETSTHRKPYGIAILNAKETI